MLILCIGCGNPKTSSTDGNQAVEENQSFDEERISGAGTVTFQIEGGTWKSSPNNPHGTSGVDGAGTEMVLNIEAWAEDGSYISFTVMDMEANLQQKEYLVADRHVRIFYKTDYEEESDNYLTDGMDKNDGWIRISEISNAGAKGSFRAPLRNAANPEDVIEISQGNFDVTFPKF